MTDLRFPPRPPPSGPVQLRTAATLLIIAAALAWIFAAISLIVQLVKGLAGLPDSTAPELKSIYFASTWGEAICDALSLVLAPILIWGMARLLRRRGYAFGRLCAVLALLPIVTNCGCVVTLPLAIWLLVILSREDVKALLGVNRAA